MSIKYCFFFRLAPSSSEAAALESDSLEMDAMVAAVRRESLTNPSYFGDVFTAALTIAARKARPEHAEQGGWQLAKQEGNFPKAAAKSHFKRCGNYHNRQKNG